MDEYTYPVTGLEWFGYSLTWAQFLMFAVCTVIVFRARRRMANPIINLLVTGALACYGLGDLFYNLYVTINRIYPYYFSASDLCWNGTFIFLIAVCLCLLGSLPEPERRATNRYRLPALAIALVVRGSVAVFVLVIYLDSIANEIVYAITQGLTLYLITLLLFTAAKNQVLTNWRRFCVAALVFTAIELATFVVTCLDAPAYNFYYVLDTLTTFTPVLFYWALLGKQVRV